LTNSAVPILHAGAFRDDPRIVAGFTTRHGGVSRPPFGTLNLGGATGDVEADVQENRRRLLASLGFPPDSLALAGQVHGSDVIPVDRPGFHPGFDALVTATPGILLAILTADCAAVLLADAHAGVVGAAHAGWRGAVAGVVGRTITAMAERGAEPSRIAASVGPCISVARFEVGPEVAAQFDARHVRRLPGAQRPRVHLQGVIVDQLIEAGLTGASIETVDRCTVSETSSFFSHRAEQGRTGRMMGFIGLRLA
jgi:polyphenol oxidase